MYVFDQDVDAVDIWCCLHNFNPCGWIDCCFMCYELPIRTKIISCSVCSVVILFIILMSILIHPNNPISHSDIQNYNVSNYTNLSHI